MSALFNTLTLEQKADLTFQMKEWVKDCQWQDIEKEDVDSMTDSELLTGIKCHYDGGIDQFIKDSVLL